MEISVDDKNTWLEYDLSVNFSTNSIETHQFRGKIYKFAILMLVEWISRMFYRLLQCNTLPEMNYSTNWNWWGAILFDLNFLIINHVTCMFNKPMVSSQLCSACQCIHTHSLPSSPKTKDEHPLNSTIMIYVTIANNNNNNNK